MSISMSMSMHMSSCISESVSASRSISVSMSTCMEESNEAGGVWTKRLQRIRRKIAKCENHTYRGTGG